MEKVLAEAADGGGGAGTDCAGAGKWVGLGGGGGDGAGAVGGDREMEGAEDGRGLKIGGWVVGVEGTMGVEVRVGVLGTGVPWELGVTRIGEVQEES